MNNNRILKAVSILIISIIFMSQLLFAGPASAQSTSAIQQFTATRSGDTLSIQVANFPGKSNYYVRVKSTFAPTSAWEKVGILRVDDEGVGSASFRLQSTVLKNASQLDICLKNVSSSKITCIVTTSTSAPMYNQNFPFTARRSQNTLQIQVSNFPANTTYNVRVKYTLASVSGWKKIGTLKVKNNGTGSVILKLPNSFKDDFQLDVCLKNVADNSLTCTTTAATSKVMIDQSRHFSAIAKEEFLSIQVRNFLNDARYYVRVRPLSGKGGAWEKIGILRVNSSGEGHATFRLDTKALKNASQLEVCLKSIGNDGIFCILTAAPFTYAP